MQAQSSQEDTGTSHKKYHAMLLSDNDILCCAKTVIVAA